MSMSEKHLPENWFHGSPLRLTTLRAGSTITGEQALARVFSHKPQVVSLDGEAGGLRLQHNGSLPGYLYAVEDVLPGDVKPHPNSSMPDGLEWLTLRELPLRLLSQTSPQPGELLSQDDIERLKQTGLNQG